MLRTPITTLSPDRKGAGVLLLAALLAWLCTRLTPHGDAQLNTRPTSALGPSHLAFPHGRSNTTLHPLPYGTPHHLPRRSPLAPRIAKRQARLTAAQFQAFACKGARLQALAKMTREEATQQLGRESESRFADYAALARWGWSAYMYNYDIETALSTLGRPLRALGIPLSSPPNRQVEHRHMQGWNDGAGERQRATLAKYQNWYNVQHGFLGASDNESPQHSVESHGLQIETLPDLQLWSDVVFLEWKYHAQTLNLPLAAPRVIMQEDIVNEETRRVVDKVFQRQRNEQFELQTDADFADFLPKWPGIEVSADSEDGLALLGSPNGRGAAWLLINRKGDFGKKMVTKIHVFSGGLGPNLAIFTGDVPEVSTHEWEEWKI